MSWIPKVEQKRHFCHKCKTELVFEVKMQRGVYLFVNKIDFKDYRKFAVEATIRLGDVAGRSGQAVTGQ